MTRPRSNILVAIGSAGLILGVIVVLLVIKHNNDNNKKKNQTAVTAPAAGAPATVPPVAGQPAVLAPLPIPAGKQALAIQTSYIQGGAGYAKQGDIVDVYGVIKGQPINLNLKLPFAKLIVQNVQVLAVTGASPATAPTSPVYLLAVDANQAEQVIFLSTFESIYLSIVLKNQPAVPTPGRAYQDLL